MMAVAMLQQVLAQSFQNPFIKQCIVYLKAPWDQLNDIGYVPQWNSFGSLGAIPKRDSQSPPGRHEAAIPLDLY